MRVKDELVGREEETAVDALDALGTARVAELVALALLGHCK